MVTRHQILTAALLILGTTTASAAQKAVKESDFGDKWPLTVSEGVVRCYNDHKLQVVTFETSGQVYAVNGTAMSKGLPRIHEIWRPDPRPEFAKMGLRVNIGPILDLGLELCE
jgi:hypothetical protein